MSGSITNKSPERDSDLPILLLNDSQTLKVRICVHQILEIDLHQETFTLEFDAFFRWCDPRLRSYSTRFWLPAEGKVAGSKTCKGTSKCICARSGQCSGLPYVEGIFREHDRTVTQEDGSVVKVETYICKEEPNFEDFGTLFGEKAGLVSFGKLMEEPLILTEFTRLTDGHQGEVILFRKMRACFKENMELRHFPLDRQLLQFSITASVPTSVCSLEVDEKFNSICRVDQLAEYTIDKDEQKAKTLTKKETKGNATGKEYSQLRATIFVQRKPGKYLVNIVLMIYLLVLASFGTFTIDIDSPGDRISIIITFVLTIMALKYVINDQLPGKDYQTWLDVYLLASYVFLIIPAVETLFLKTWSPDAEMRSEHHPMQAIDVIFGCLLFGIWNALHVLLFFAYIFDLSCLHQTWDQVQNSQDDKAVEPFCWSRMQSEDHQYLCFASDSDSRSS